MKCPRCKANLKPESFLGVAIEKCSACKGLWLDEGELVILIRKAEEIVIKSQFINDELKLAPGIGKEELDSKELCPKCNAQMIPVNYDYSSGVSIDSCPNNHGVWLDDGELERACAHRLLAQKAAAEKSPELLKKITDIVRKSPANR